jgi:hypothetical protein
VSLLALGACDSAADAPTPSQGRSGSLPGPFELLPSGVRGATNWTTVTALVDSFDARAAYESPEAVADAFGAALLEGYPPGPDRPRLTLEPAIETEERAILVVGETGFGDPLIAGNQHALVVVSGTDGWYVTSVWSRILCVGDVHPTGAHCA